jgi:homoserine kinase type II
MNNAHLTTQQLSAIFHEYSPHNVVSAVRSTEAFANEVYDITDTQGERYFLKILKAQLPEAIATEAQMQQRLLAAGLQTPQYIEIKPGAYVGSHDGIKFILSRFIPGKSPKVVTPALIESFGATLARLHDALGGVHITASDMQWLKLERVQSYGYTGDTKDDLATLVNTGKRIFEGDLPTAVIHGDLWMSNVFASGDTITTVFDLETAEHTVRLVDLARTYTSMKFNSNYTLKEIVAGLVVGYNSAATQPLTAGELTNVNLAIAYVAGACGTWHAVHGTRYRDPYIRFGKEALQEL